MKCIRRAFLLWISIKLVFNGYENVVTCLGDHQPGQVLVLEEVKFDEEHRSGIRSTINGLLCKIESNGKLEEKKSIYFEILERLFVLLQDYDFEEKLYDILFSFQS